MEESEVVRQLRQGGVAADNAICYLHKMHAKDLVKFYCYKQQPLSVAEDLTQEVFIKLVKHPDTFRGEASIKTWLWKVASNVLIDHVRKHQYQKQEIRADDDWDTLVEQHAELQVANAPTTKQTLEECVQAVIAELHRHAPERAYALSLKCEDLSDEDIAIRLGRSHGATREFLSQCRKKVAEYVSHCRDLYS